MEKYCTGLLSHRPDTKSVTLRRMPFDGIGRIRRVTSVPSTNMNRVFFRGRWEEGGADISMLFYINNAHSKILLYLSLTHSPKLTIPDPIPWRYFFLLRCGFVGRAGAGRDRSETKRERERFGLTKSHLQWIPIITASMLLGDHPVRQQTSQVCLLFFFSFFFFLFVTYLLMIISTIVS